MADNSHAERKIFKRAVESAVDVYDHNGGLTRDWKARAIATDVLALDARIPWDDAARLLADALARRAANKLENTHGTP